MNTEKLEHFKKLLLNYRTRILNGGVLSTKEDLMVAPEDLADETDLASSVISQQVTFHMRKRELDKLRSIEEALQRVEDGDYGHCEECGEAIGEKRLETQPWTTLCIVHAEERERESVQVARSA